MAKEIHSFSMKGISPSEVHVFPGGGQLQKDPVVTFVGFGEHKSRPPRAELDGQ